MKEHQSFLSSALAEANHRIVIENKHQQYLPGLGIICPTQLYWHQNIEKQAVTKGKVKKRIPATALLDGVHASKEITKNWHWALHLNYQKQLDRIYS